MSGAARFLSELRSSLWAEGGTGQGSSAPIFDAGTEGLFFAAFGPLYARYRGTSFDYKCDIAARYDGQREFAFGKLRADAERLRGLCAAMAETSLDFRDAAAPLFEAWEGEAASAAREHVDGMVGSASSAWGRLGALADMIDAAVDGAERIALDKARAVRALALDRVGGLAAGEVELLVRAAADGMGMTDARLGELATLCDVDANPAVCRTNRDLLDQVVEDVRDWLEHAFAPVYEARAAAFDAACAAAEVDLAVAWDGLRELLDQIAGQGLSIDAPAAAPVGGAPVASATPTPGAAPAPPEAAVAESAAPVQGFGGAAADAPPDPAPTEPPSSGVRTGAGETDLTRMEAGTASAATGSPEAGVRNGPLGYGYGFFPVGGAVGAQGGGDRDHVRKVSLAGGEIVSGVDDPASEVLGAQEELESEPEPEPEPEQPKETETYWQLGEDGELHCLTKPAG